MTRLISRTVFWLTCGSLLLPASHAGAEYRSSLPDPDERIRFYSEKLSRHPRLHQVYALLAFAYIDKAGEELDPDYIAKARTALKRSQEIQTNLTLFKASTALANFTHHFDEAVQWGQRAIEVDPNDTGVRAQLVEAYMGQGRYEKAARLFPPVAEPLRDFHTAVSLGQWLAQQKRYEEAADAFMIAAALAGAQGRTDSAAWARIKVGGTFLDRGQGALARSHLAAATHLAPRSQAVRRELGVHWAEFHQAQGLQEKALVEYEALLERRNHPMLHHRAFLLARSLGRRNQARQHFVMAEERFQRVIDAGEIFTLGALARLYADGGIHIDKAIDLAQRNMRHTRNLQAQATVAYVRSKQWLPSRPITSKSRRLLGDNERTNPEAPEMPR